MKNYIQDPLVTFAGSVLVACVIMLFLYKYHNSNIENLKTTGTITLIYKEYRTPGKESFYKARILFDHNKESHQKNMCVDKEFYDKHNPGDIVDIIIKHRRNKILSIKIVEKKDGK